MRRAEREMAPERSDPPGDAGVCQRRTEPYAAAVERLSGAVRRSLQSGGYSGRIYSLPPCKARQNALPLISSRRMKTARRITRTPAICRSDTQRISSPRSMYRMNCRRSIPPARYSCLPRRKAAGLEGGGKPRSENRGELPPTVLHAVADLPVCKNHGYLAGEQPVCPFCGEKAEVYSRITGYYRPVQNWNDGKAQNSRIAERMTSVHRS